VRPPSQPQQGDESSLDRENGGEEGGPDNSLNGLTVVIIAWVSVGCKGRKRCIYREPEMSYVSYVQCREQEMGVKRWTKGVFRKALVILGSPQ